MSSDSFGARDTLEVSGREFEIFRLDALQASHDVARLPYSLKVLLENALRLEDGESVTRENVEAIASWDATAEPSSEIPFQPARVLMQDFTGVPALVDLAAMRDAMDELGGDAATIDPLVPVDLIIDHSVQVDAFGNARAFDINADRDYERNGERYAFLRWGQRAFHNLRVVPPATGICHQVNLEYLGQVVFTASVGARRGAAAPGLSRHPGGHRLAHDDDQRPGSARLGRGRDRGRGGDARPADLDAAPPGRRLQAHRGAVRGRDGDRPGADGHPDAPPARRRGQVRGVLRPGLHTPGLADRATIGNMSPEFGSTCAIFPVDRETLRYLEFTGRPTELIELVDAYAREQGLFHTEDSEEPTFSELLELELGDVEPSIAGPEAPPGPDRARRGEARVHRGAAGLRARKPPSSSATTTTRPSPSPFRPPTRPATTTTTSAASRVRRPRRDGGHRGAPGRPGHGHARGRNRGRARPRPRRDRRDHELHEHLQPLGDGGRGAAGEEGGRARARRQAVGEDLAGPGLHRGHRLPRAGGAHRLPRQAQVQPGRLRLHHLHRQLRPAARGDLGGGRRQGPGGLRGAVRATATSRAGSTRT